MNKDNAITLEGQSKVKFPPPVLVRKSLLRASQWLCLLSVISSCKPMPPAVIARNDAGEILPAPLPPEEGDEEKALALLAKAEQLEKEGFRQSGEQQRLAMISQYPGTRAGARELRRRAESSTNDKLFGLALVYYEKLLLHHTDLPDTDELKTTYARLLAEGGRYKDVLRVMREPYEQSSTLEIKLERLAILREAMLRLAQYMGALEMHMELRDNKDLSSAQKDTVDSVIRDIIGKRLSFEETNELWENLKNRTAQSEFHALTAMRLAKIHYHIRDFQRAKDMLETVVGTYSTSTYSKDAKTLLERLQARSVVKANKIGVILPTSGRFKRYGERALAAIQSAFDNSHSITLVMRDSSGKPEIASQAVEDLVLQENVIGIIGPLFSKSSQAAAIKAEELGVPLIALSHHRGLPEIGPYIFRTALTIQAQAEALAALAFDRLGMSRFVILHPNNKYGKDFAHSFWDEVERRQGEIRGIEEYEHNQTSFQNEVRMIVGRRYHHARPEYVHKLDELRALDLPSHRFKAAIEKFTKGLPPMVDFDAIIIPDSGRTVGLLAPALAFEDIVLTRDPQMLRTIKKATGNKNIKPVFLLGGSTWNSAQTLESCERYCEDALFVDAYFGNHPSSRVRDFVSMFQEKTQAQPQLREAEAYDTGSLVRRTLVTNHPKTRDEFREALLGQKGFHGVTGKLRFNDKGDCVRELFTLTIKEGEIFLWKDSGLDPQG
jgi:branched-chain amino acid transport system substrate-binding protein